MAENFGGSALKRKEFNEAGSVYGDGEQTRDFIHVDDICQMIYRSLLAEPGKVAGQIFQAARIDIIYEPERKGEIRRNFADINKAREVLGFEPKIDLPLGLQQLWEWYLKQF